MPDAAVEKDTERKLALCEVRFETKDAITRKGAVDCEPAQFLGFMRAFRP